MVKWFAMAAAGIVIALMTPTITGVFTSVYSGFSSNEAKFILQVMLPGFAILTMYFLLPSEDSGGRIR